MKLWWQRLQTREQTLVGLKGAIVAIFIFYSAVWQPLNEGLTKATQKLERQQALLTWVSDNTARFKEAQDSSKAKQGGGSLSGIVNRSANSYQLTVTRVQPQGDSLQVWLDSVPFTQLLFWLEHLVSSQGLIVEGIDLTRADRSGEVKVRRLQLAKR